MQTNASAQQADPAKQTTSLPGNHTDPAIVELARQLAGCKPRRTSFTIPTRLKQYMGFFRACYEHFEENSKRQVAASQASDWLMNNFYVLERTVRQVEQDLPEDYYQRLPKSPDGMTRIYLVALANTRRDDTPLDIELIRHFLDVFQKFTPLNTGELWALPLMLRLVVLETLAKALAAVTKLTWESMPRPNLPPGVSWFESAREDPDGTVANSILNLRLLATQDWKEFIEAASILEQILRRDPAGVYTHMNFDTRNHYRNVVEELANGSFMDEVGIATKAIELAKAGQGTREQHVGYYLIAHGRDGLEAEIEFRPRFSLALIRAIQRNNTAFYLGSIVLVTLLIGFLVVLYASRAGGTLASAVVAGLLSLLPISSVATDFINGLVISLIPPRRLPKLHLEHGVPSKYRTMVVIPALLATERDAPFLLSQLERHFIGNNDPNLFFGLVTDFADAPEKEMPEDEAPIAWTRAAIEELNKKYERGGYRPFYFFHRGRVWSESEECWIGWERKRGKLEEFNRLLNGNDSTTFLIKDGKLDVLPTIRFVITLDADTVLPREAARQLIATLAHPLNRAEFHPATDEVIAGHTILQPRAQVRPAAANRSLFTRVYSGDSAIDLYTRAVSDVYQDLFDEGNYVGKGIYDIEAFQRSLHDKIPENRLLSHDLFEGMQGRCGLVTDIVLFEDYPPHYLVYTDRLHRWVRGDWQLLPWLANRVPHRTQGKVCNTLTILERWKLFDNMRRSLVPLGVLSLLCSGWLLLPGSSLFWMLVALSPYMMVVLGNVAAELEGSLAKQHSRQISRPTHLAILRSLFGILFLPHEAYVVFNAVSTTLVRLFITRKRMLQWVSAAHTVQLFGKTLHLKSAWQAMIVAPVLAILFSILLFILDLPTLIIASPLLLGWVASPYIATRISRPYRQPVKQITPAQELKLRLLARSTWLYFEHFVGPEDRWLPPDHFQEEPRGMVAHHTSPTNIGLMLLSTLSAHDLGYIGPLELSLRLRDSFDSMDALERVRGHFLNWYDTRSFAPLPPRYISTVDSGNLAACLITLQQGCNEISKTEVVNWQGLQDTLNMLALTLAQGHLGPAADKLQAAINSLESLVKKLSDRDQFTPDLLMQLFQEGQAELEAMWWGAVQQTDEDTAPDTLRKLSIWIDRVRHQLQRIRMDIQVLAPWLLIMAKRPRPAALKTNPEIASAWQAFEANLPLHPQLGVIPDICQRASQAIEELTGFLSKDDLATAEWCDALAYDLQSARNNCLSLLNNFSTLASRAESFVESMPFGFLYDPQRHVFHIGYNLESGRLASNYYGLITTEARIASLVAIARGDVPQDHWLHLSRPITEFNGARCLLSWSGTMFEYLMPGLFIESYPNTLMDESCRLAIEQQIKYGAERNIPWGISEASYYNFDAAQVYQYQAFGIPSLGYKRGLTNDLVVAPYASVLALPYMPQAVIQNVERLESLKMWGLYGFYESVDFTTERLKTGESHAIIRSYMVHHQGMILLSLCNYLFDKRMIRRFHADPHIQSVELLLQEQAPEHIPTEPRATRKSIQSSPLRRSLWIHGEPGRRRLIHTSIKSRTTDQPFSEDPERGSSSPAGRRIL